MEHKSSLLFEVERDSTQEASEIGLTAFESQAETEKVLVVRLDKWLWAARCFKTLALARAAVEQGKVFYDGQKTLPSKEIACGGSIIIQQGKHRKVLIVKRLLTRRRSIDESNPFFEELSSPVTDDGDACYGNNSDRRSRRIARFLRRSTPETGELHHFSRK